jgi:hypothetical protein
MGDMKKNKGSIGSIILGIILLFSISSIAGFKIAQKTYTKVNVVAASTSENSGISSRSQKLLIIQIQKQILIKVAAGSN